MAPRGLTLDRLPSLRVIRFQTIQRLSYQRHGIIFTRPALIALDREVCRMVERAAARTRLNRRVIVRGDDV